MSLLLTAVGLVLFIEGLFYSGFPSLVKKMASQIGVTPDNVLRVSGLVAMGIGVLIIWLCR